MVSERARERLLQLIPTLCTHRKYPWGVVSSALDGFEQQQLKAGEDPSYFFIE